MNNNCGMIGDLLPLYLDSGCSKESCTAIEAHLQTCAECREKLVRMKAETIAPFPAEQSVSITRFAKKVKQRRIRTVIGAALGSVVAAFLLALLFLTFQDMHRTANPSIHPLEEGTFDLTAGALETSADTVGNFILFTNNEAIEVTLNEKTAVSCEIVLWNADNREEPVPILYGTIHPGETSCIFQSLSSAYRYRITCSCEDMVLTVSDGRHISFFGSLRNVLEDLISIVLDF